MPRNYLIQSLQNKDFRLFLGVRFAATFGAQMISTLMAWQVYSITHDPLSLGLIGLFEVIPFMLVTLIGGHYADKISRRKIIIASEVLLLLSAVALYLISKPGSINMAIIGVWPIYCINIVTGIARAFLFPAMSAMRANIIKGSDIQNSIAWNVNVWYTAAIAGPALAGLLYGPIGVADCYLIGSVFFVVALISAVAIKESGKTNNPNTENIFASLKKGISFVMSQQLILGAISLDLFAVLFGGVVAVLPVFAAEILHIDALGLGLLRSSPFIGALLSGIYVSSRPIRGKVGLLLIGSIVLFGMANLTFGFSTNFYLSMAMMIISGAADNISVFIRHTIMQLYVPDEMRGRVSSVEGIFISSSNELGSFESGFAAKLLGLVPSVVFGAGMTFLSTVLAYKFAPKLRKLIWD